MSLWVYISAYVKTRDNRKFYIKPNVYSSSFIFFFYNFLLRYISSLRKLIFFFFLYIFQLSQFDLCVFIRFIIIIFFKNHPQCF